MQQFSSSPATVGMAVGLTAAIAVLVAAGIRLAVADDSGVRALVAVWLWALPALGTFALAGWLAGRGIGRAFGGERR